MQLVQVESLVVELDDLAVRQGEEEARRHQNLIEEVEDLRAQLILAKRDTSHVSGEGQCSMFTRALHWSIS
jgi:hypothetical protein